MKSIPAFAALLALMAAPAFAQSSPAPAPVPAPAEAVASIGTCGPAPSAPALPAIDTLKTAKAISAATDSLNAYLSLSQANLLCRRTAIEAERAEMLAKQSQLQAQTEAYNNDVRAITEIRDGWDAQVKAYNDKQNKTRR